MLFPIQAGREFVHYGNGKSLQIKKWKNFELILNDTLVNITVYII